MVKSSSRELCYIILAGIFLGYVCPFTLIAKPTTTSCYLQRLLVGLSSAMCYSALVTKTNRIARILAGSKKKICTRKPRFMSAWAQVIIASILIGVQLTLVVTLIDQIRIKNWIYFEISELLKYKRTLSNEIP